MLLGVLSPSAWEFVHRCRQRAVCTRAKVLKFIDYKNGVKKLSARERERERERLARRRVWCVEVLEIGHLKEVAHASDIRGCAAFNGRGVRGGGGGGGAARVRTYAQETLFLRDSWDHIRWGGQAQPSFPGLAPSATRPVAASHMVAAQIAMDRACASSLISRV